MPVHAKTLSVTPDVPDPVRNRLYSWARGQSIRILPSHVPVDMQIFHASSPDMTRSRIETCLSRASIPVAAYPTHSLPHWQGMHWEKFGSSAHALLPDAETRLSHITDPGDWPLPKAYTKEDWRPRCHINRETLESLPAWLLYDQRLVFLGGPKAEALTEDLVAVATGKKSRRTEPAILSGPDLLWATNYIRFSALMSVAGWPLRYVPIRYLLFLVGSGDYTGDDAPLIYTLHVPEDFHNQIDPFTVIPVKPAGAPGSVEVRREPVRYLPSSKWVNGSPVQIRYSPQTPWVTVRSAGFSPAYGLLRHWLQKYLDSAEGKARIAAVEEDTSEDWNAPRPGQNPSLGCGCWTGRPAVVETYSQADWESPRRKDADGTWHSFFDPQASRPVLRPSDDIIEAFSSKDTDRFGPWGSGPDPVWIDNGKNYSLTRRIRRAARQDDHDPTLSCLVLGLAEGPYGPEMPLWRSPRVDEPQDWKPPPMPYDELDAYRVLLAIQSECEYLQTDMGTRWDRYNEWVAQNALNPHTEFTFGKDRQQIADRLRFLWWRLKYHVEPTLGIVPPWFVQVEELVKETLRVLQGKPLVRPWEDDPRQWGSLPVDHRARTHLEGDEPEPSLVLLLQTEADQHLHDAPPTSSLLARETDLTLSEAFEDGLPDFEEQEDEEPWAAEEDEIS